MSAKEINIKFPGQILDYVDTKEHLLELFNHITNLQEELKSANESITWWTNRFNAVQRDYEDYKSRCEIAIDMLDNYQNNLYSKSARKTLDDDIERTLNILKGSDKN